MTCGCRSLRAHLPLVALAVGVPVLEALVLAAVGASDPQALAPQSTAPAPFGVFHDLRWLLVFHSSWVGFAAGVLALLAVRSALTALLVRAAWPVSQDPPPTGRLIAGSAAFTVVSTLALAPFAALLLGMAVVSLSWLFFVAVPSALGVAALVHHGAVVPVWWRNRPPDRTVGWILLSFLVLTLASAAVVLAPAPLRLPAVAATGLFNAWAWQSIVHTLCCGERSRRFMPIAPVGVAALVAVIIVGATTGFAVSSREGRWHRTTQTTPAGFGRPVLIVSGFGSHYGGGDDPLTGGAATGRGHGGAEEQRFSYAGITPEGRPRPYRSADTLQDLAHSVELMARQVDAFHAVVGEPLTIVAESEGALVAKAYLMANPGAPVDTLVMLSPLIDPGSAYYPPPGEEGWGVASGWGLHWITTFVAAVSPLDVSTDDGLFRSLVDNAPALRNLLACPLDGVEQLTVLPLADAVVGPDPGLDTAPAVVVPAFHGGLTNSEAARATIRLALDGGRSSGSLWWEATDRLIRAGATAWRVPTLPASVNPAWEGMDDVDTCPEMAAAVASW